MQERNFYTDVRKSPMLEEIILDTNKITEIKTFVEKVITKKIKEAHHKIDRHNESKRWYTGLAGEAAVEQYLGVNFMDFTVGDSKNYFVSDMSKLGLSIGVKTVENEKYPIIHKKNMDPQIIVVKMSDSKFYICGISSPDVLNRYQDDNLILSPSLKKKNTKTGFYGFKYLKYFCKNIL